MRLARRGFSLVELLMVISVIAVITAIALQKLGTLTGTAGENSARQTAQMVVSISKGAQIAGDETIAAADDMDAALDLLSAGLVGKGTFEGSEYRVALDDELREKARQYLVFEDGVLAFRDEGDDD